MQSSSDSYVNACNCLKMTARKSTIVIPASGKLQSLYIFFCFDVLL